MGAIPIAVIVVITLALVLGLGLLIFSLMRRSQEVVPRIADDAAHRDRVVAVDDEGRPVTESEEGGETAPRDDAAFDAALKEELKDLGR